MGVRDNREQPWLIRDEGRRERVVEEDSTRAKVEQMKKGVASSEPRLQSRCWMLEQFGLKSKKKKKRSSGQKHEAEQEHKQANFAPQCHPFPFLSIPLLLCLSSSFVSFHTASERKKKKKERNKIKTPFEANV